MKQTAEVVRENGRLMALVMRPEACETCHACKFGTQERVLVELPGGKFQVGDTVELELHDGRVGMASLIAYGIPLAALLIGLWLGGLFGGNELFQVVGAIIMVCLSLLLIRALEPKLRASGKYAPTACKSDDSHN